MFVAIRHLSVWSGKVWSGLVFQRAWDGRGMLGSVHSSLLLFVAIRLVSRSVSYYYGNGFPTLPPARYVHSSLLLFVAIGYRARQGFREPGTAEGCTCAWDGRGLLGFL